MHTCVHTDTHTPLFLLAFFSVISSNTTLSSCLITKQGHYICLHELPSLCGCVCRCVWGIRSLTLAHTDTHKHLSMPLGPCAQLSVSLILFPLISTHPPTPTSCSSSFSLTSHPFLIIPGSYSLSLSLLGGYFFFHYKRCIFLASTGVMDFQKRYDI